MNDLAAVCCFFNPIGFKSRINNYYRFREAWEKSKVPLITIECAFNHAPFQIRDAEFRLRSNSVLWQKERLLNIGINRLVRQGVKKIMWTDADIEFKNSDWPTKISDALDTTDAIQCFSTLTLNYTDKTRHFEECTAKTLIENRRFLGPATGGAWAFRASFIRDVPLYEHMILGAGDQAHVQAFMPRNKHVMDLSTITQKNHYYAWWEDVRPFAESVRLGWADNAAEFLVHGSWQNRAYGTRKIDLRDYDPATDIKAAKDQPFEWATNKTDLHERVRKYFENRNEDEVDMRPTE